MKYKKKKCNSTFLKCDKPLPHHPTWPSCTLHPSLPPFHPFTTKTASRSPLYCITHSAINWYFFFVHAPPFFQYIFGKEDAVGWGEEGRIPFVCSIFFLPVFIQYPYTMLFCSSQRDTKTITPPLLISCIYSVPPLTLSHAE